MRLAFVSDVPSFGVVWPRLADEQIFIGPQQGNLDFGGRIFSRRTPVGSFDLARTLRELPPAQRPDVVACLVDGQTVSWPRNLAECNQTRVLLVGDSESAPGGLARIINYAIEEKFDRIVLTGAGVDERVFRSLQDGVHWFPGLLCGVRDDWLPIVRQNERAPVLFGAPLDSRGCGALHSTHKALALIKTPIQTWAASSDLRVEEFGDSAAVLIAAEQGEWSEPLFEALSAGTVVIASGLAQEDIGRVWPTGAPILVAEDGQAMAQLAVALLNDPSGNERLRSEAMRWYDGFLGGKQRRDAFFRILKENVGPIEPVSGPALAKSIARKAASCSPAVHIALESVERPGVWLGAAGGELGAFLLQRFPRLERSDSPVGAMVELGSSAGADSAVASQILLDCLDDSPPMGFDACPDVPRTWVSRRVAQVRAECDAMWQSVDRGDFARALELGRSLATKWPDSIEGFLGIMEVLVEAGSPQGWERCLSSALRIGPHDPRLTSVVARQRSGEKRGVLARIRRASALWVAGEVAEAREIVSALLDKKVTLPSLFVLVAQLADESGDRAAAADAWLRAARHQPNDDRLWFVAGLALWRAGRRGESGHALRRAAGHSPWETDFVQVFAHCCQEDPSIATHTGRTRNLVVTSSENCQKHGAGVLIKRCFGAHLDTVTLRPATYYDGVEEAGSAHFCIPFRELSSRRLQTRLRRLLAPYDIQRILCVPFHRHECIYAVAAHEVTRARLCTYVMDDRNVLIADTDDSLLRDLFARSSLRLTISSEMQMAYTIKYDFDFEVLPPIVTDRAARRQNRWSPRSGTATHVALVGSIWTEGQLRQMLKFVVRAGLTVDWFGRQASADLSAAGVNAMGFVSERELADRLVDYPLVLVPSGMLDGSEDNEWLTRLSLPSRIVFLLQTQCPILVLGSKDTCASRHVAHLGIGRVIPYNHPSPQQVVAEMTAPTARAKLLAAASRAADGFVMPDAGQWIWASTDSGMVGPAPFHKFMERVPEFEVVWPPSHAGRIAISHNL